MNLRVELQFHYTFLVNGIHLQLVLILIPLTFGLFQIVIPKRKRKIHGKLNASWKISSLAVNGQSFLVIDGYLLDFNHVSFQALRFLRE